MSQSIIKIPAEYIVPLNMNGLRGRMLRLPPPKGKSREALVIYGHHSSLERLYSLAQVINEDIGVTMPDMPGFGGMDSFYKIHEKPDLDTMADYLASFVKLRYKKGQRFTIIAVSYGFVAVTRMLERYPEIAKQVDLLISVVGFTNKEEFKFSRTRYFFYLHGSSFFSHRLSSMFFRAVILHPTVLRNFYGRTHNAKHKFVDLNEESRSMISEFEIWLWRLNDVRTNWATTVSFLKLDNTIGTVDLPVWHVHTKSDNYFNTDLIEANMRKIFTDCHPVIAPVKNHMPNVIASKEESAVLFPKKIRQLLRAAPKKNRLSV